MCARLPLSTFFFEGQDSALRKTDCQHANIVWQMAVEMPFVFLCAAFLQKNQQLFHKLQLASSHLGDSKSFFFFLFGND